MPVFVNGKFCAQRTTGVQRYARCALLAIDAQLAARASSPDWTLLLPPGAEPPALRAIGVRHVPWRGPGGLHGWEQVALHRAARGGVLLNLAGSAPALRVDRQVCVLHDAAPFDQPSSYTHMFSAWYRWLFRRLAQRPAASLVTVSEFSRRQLALALGVPVERLHVAPGGAQHLDGVEPDNSVLAARGLDRQPFVLAVGSHNPSKNLARLAEAWRGLGRPGVKLVLVGGGNARVFAQHGAAAATPDAVDLGPIDDAGLKAVYRQALAFVFPSLYEGFGLPPLEAMACGCPVVASSVPAVREVCGDAVLYVDPAAPQAIAAALQRVIDEPALRAALRERGLARAARWRWDATARALLAAVEDVR
jgi:glycosyltransferase involved in cell wall biosynthesis